jgi:hypothetical protein
MGNELFVPITRVIGGWCKLFRIVKIVVVDVIGEDQNHINCNRSNG